MPFFAFFCLFLPLFSSLIFLESSERTMARLRVGLADTGLSPPPFRAPTELTLRVRCGNKQGAIFISYKGLNVQLNLKYI
jgi:hypothetical protein